MSYELNANVLEVVKEEKCVSLEETITKPKTRAEHLKDYVKEIRKLEAEVAKLQELKKDFKAAYVDNKWLTKDDIKMVHKAMSLLKQEVDINELVEVIEQAAKVY